MRIPTNREPTHPSEILLEEFLLPMDITQKQLADAIKVPYQRVNELVNISGQWAIEQWRPTPTAIYACASGLPGEK